MLPISTSKKLLNPPALHMHCLFSQPCITSHLDSCGILPWYSPYLQACRAFSKPFSVGNKKANGYIYYCLYLDQCQLSWEILLHFNLF